jgi:hypothetical protein
MIAFVTDWYAGLSSNLYLGLLLGPTGPRQRGLTRTRVGMTMISSGVVGVIVQLLFYNIIKVLYSRQSNIVLYTRGSITIIIRLEEYTLLRSTRLLTLSIRLNMRASATCA